MDYKRLFEKRKKNNCRLIQTIKVYSQDLRIECGIEIFVILIIKSGKQTNNESNRTAKGRKNQNSSRKRKRRVLWNIVSEYHQTIGSVKNFKKKKR